MNKINLFLLSFISCFSFIVNAESNPLSVHVLNLENGLPSSGIEVKLEQRTESGWKLLNSATTNEQGRIIDLYPEGEKIDSKATYKVTFETGKWFEKNKTETFFPEVPVIFKANGNLKHYHIPLLLSPYGYSTYRGN